MLTFNFQILRQEKPHRVKTNTDSCTACLCCLGGYFPSHKRNLFCSIFQNIKIYHVTHWLRQGVYEFLSSSMMETMRVMSLDQKSRFLMLGPCSSGGTAFDWKRRENKGSQMSPFQNLSAARTQSSGEQGYCWTQCMCLRDLQDLSGILCCTDHDSCWKCTRRWSWGRLLRNPSPPDSPLGGSAVPGPEHKRFKIFYSLRFMRNTKNMSTNS